MSKKFRYPIGNGTREDFESRYYKAFGFGEKTDYGYHEGSDLNLKATDDLGEPIYAIADWIRKYYHLKAHLESGFGEHFAYQVESPWGLRWIHCAHCQKSINFEGRESGVMGEKLSEIDKSGRPRFVLPSHLHLSVFKIDPADLPNGIDTIAKNASQLNSLWEDPIEFFKNWYDYKDEEIDVDIKQIITDGYKVFTGRNPRDDEMAWRLKEWKSPAEFFKSITGDGSFYKIYIQPQLDAQKSVLESACNTEKEHVSEDWQSKFDTANKEWTKKYNVLELKKVENLPALQVISMGIKKLFSFLGNVGR